LHGVDHPRGGIMAPINRENEKYGVKRSDGGVGETKDLT